jgi:putative ABC transport system ATP-binding protein
MPIHVTAQPTQPSSIATPSTDWNAGGPQDTRGTRKPVLVLDQVSKRYAEPAGGHIEVLKPVTLSVYTGETVAVIGPSGSGKTTLLGLSAGLDAPSAGTISLAGVPLNGLDEDARARVRSDHVGFVFQNFQLIPTLTALENVMVPAELRGRSGRELRREASEWLARVGLGERLEHYPVQLSGGEQQRVALARAFINRPGVLFADEPTGNLDGETAARVEDLLFDLNRASGTTLIIVTHNPALAARCGRSLRMASGVMREDPNAQAQ